MGASALREERQPWRWWAPLSLYPLIASVFSCTSIAWPNNGASCNEIWIGPWRKYKNLGIPAASRRSLSARDFYSCSKHYGCWYMKVRLNLPDAAIAAQAG
jgi:hypothetical protein